MIAVTAASGHIRNCTEAEILLKIQMLKIQRTANERIVFKLSGRIEAGDPGELKKLFELEAEGSRLVLDLKDVTLVDREGVKFLALCETDSIDLQNCPAYIREWIERESGARNLRKR